MSTTFMKVTAYDVWMVIYSKHIKAYEIVSRKTTWKVEKKPVAHFQ